MILQGTPFASILAMMRTSPTLIHTNVYPVLVLVSDMPNELPAKGIVTHQATELDSLAFHQNEALRQTPAHGLVYFVRKRGAGLVRDRIGIGRDHNADICVPSPRMSRYHAFFGTGSGTDWMITDANSKNGSRVNGIRIGAGTSSMLSETTSIALGSIEFGFYLPAHFLALCKSFLMGDMPSEVTVTR
jgi:pSer/pThr/pTyr-binding forkhead associated (FHA) protein